MIVWGGGRLIPEQLAVQGGRYNPLLNRWALTTALDAPVPRYSQQAVWTGSQMIVWGGLDAGKTPLDTGGSYDPVTDRWSGAGAPKGRAGHTAT